MRANYGMRNRQRGVVAVIMGIAAIALFAFMGIAVDLAYTYSRKTELMNAADAASLSGAKELNEKAAGVTAAIAKAIATFSDNNTNNFVGSSFVITAANLRLGSCPNADDRLPLRFPNCTFVAASSVTTDAAAAGKTFLEVATPSQTRPTFFMLVTGAANATTSTFGYAVAGRFVNDVTPIGVCAIDPVNKTNKYIYDFPAGTSEIVEAGYRRGVTYNIFNLNPLAGAVSDPYLLNPVEAPPTACNPSHSSAAFTGPFVCTGSSAIVSGGALSVYTNTGYSTGPIEAALNSRFDSYGGPSPCDPATAPPDSNVKEYHCTGAGTDCLNNPPAGAPRDWMEPLLNVLPNRESVVVNPNPANPGTNYGIPPPSNKPVYRLPPANNAAVFMPNEPTTNNTVGATPVTFPQYGALWSYGPAYQADASTPPKAGLPFTPAVANTVALYNQSLFPLPPPPYFDLANYPLVPGTGFPLTTPAAPYNQTAGNYFQAPPTHPPGTRNRRILNMVIVDCRNPPVGSAACGVMPIVGVGKFFMQTPADFTGGPANRRLMVEFAGLIDPVPVAEVKLYR